MQFNYYSHSKSSGIYVIFNKINWKLYIGSTVEFKKRWIQGHLRSLRKNIHKSKHLQASWNKYGEDAFEFHVVEHMPNSTREERLKREDEWIVIHWERGNLYNCLRKAMCPSSNRKRGYKRSPEECKAISLGRLGMKFTPEHIENNRNARIGLKHSEEHKAKIGAAHRGMKRPLETGQKISKSKLGKKRLDMSRLITFEGQIKSLTDWSILTGLSVSTIKGRLDRGWEINRVFTTPVQLKYSTGGAKYLHRIM